MVSLKPMGPAQTGLRFGKLTAPALQAPVNRILPFSCVDGPGSRMVVFFQGCNMNCPSCHNPHTIGHCNHCLDCVPHCPNGALVDASVNGKRKLAHSAPQCQNCESCLPHCGRNGSPYARRHDVASLVKQIADHAPLLDGVTFSGGEATLQHRFLGALMAQLKLHPECAHLSLLIDSNGLTDGAHWDGLLPHADGVMLDIKAMEPALHKTLTGRDNAKVLASARLLAEQDKLAELRFLLIEHHNDSDAELDALAALIRALPGQRPLKLNGFRHHGVREQARQWAETTELRLRQVASQLQQQGIDARINAAP
ncbi:YjjW family glycine radical enzyme activase [Ferrimonas balearica]|uniref:YjjW family glycine radical enzyme activase n=1 Tax=Ferrimonas balearica TaxID=44012 RepID=UPI001C93A9D7|nr:YjjW family glycine radical enzyme activase [Ferrimonas balearica]